MAISSCWCIFPGVAGGCNGFNFYNGLRDQCKVSPEWFKFYWIDFALFAKQFISQDQEIKKIKYFTAPPMNQSKRSRQSALFSANTLLNPTLFEVVQGKYYNKNIFCKLCKGVFQLPEEKRTDVNISVHLLLDCFYNKADKLILVTADSDLVPPIEAIKYHFPEKIIKIYFPPLRTSADLLKLCKPVVFLENNKTKFENAIMPDIVEANGKKYSKPVEWHYS